MVNDRVTIKVIHQGKAVRGYGCVLVTGGAGMTTVTVPRELLEDLQRQCMDVRQQCSERMVAQAIGLYTRINATLEQERTCETCVHKGKAVTYDEDCMTCAKFYGDKYEQNS